MKDLMSKLMEKKKEQGPMDENYKAAKMSTLEALLNEMHGMMGNDLKGIKKVEVASPDKEGLSQGLDKAKQMLGKDPNADDESEDKDGDSDFEESVEDHDPTTEAMGLNGAEVKEDPFEGMDESELRKQLMMLKMKLGEK